MRHTVLTRISWSHGKALNPHGKLVFRGGSKAAATFKMECFVIIINGWKQWVKVSYIRFVGFCKNHFLKDIRLSFSFEKWPYFQLLSIKLLYFSEQNVQSLKIKVVLCKKRNIFSYWLLLRQIKKNFSCVYSIQGGKALFKVFL